MKHMKYAGRSLLSFASYNLGWWACAFGPKWGMPWLGPALIPFWVGVHLYYSPTRLGELLFFIALAAFGFAFDSLMIFAGVFRIIPETHFAPMWLVSMWVLLGLTFESMLVMRRNRWLTCLAGVMSGPLCYLFAEAVDILAYHAPWWGAIAVHGLIWAVLMPFLFTIRDSMIRLGLRARDAA
jgi:hypothetical protein